MVNSRIWHYLVNISVALCVIALFALGTWQLFRMQEKKLFISSIERNIRDKPLELSKLEGVELYSKVKIGGKFIDRENILLYGRRTALPEKDGYYVLSLFQTETNELILVMRGWIPQSAKHEYTSNNNIFDRQTITAMVMPGEKRSLFMPHNDTLNNIWFCLDVKLAASLYHLSHDSFYLMQIESPELLPKGMIPLSTTYLAKVRNDHLEYAITWYSLGFCLIGIVLYKSRKKGG